MIAKYIEDARELGAKMNTVVKEDNRCFSACFFIFLAGEKRIAYKNSYFQFHDVRFSPSYNPEEWELGFLDEYRVKYIETISKYSKKLIDFLEYVGIFEDESESVVLKGDKIFENFPGISTELKK